MQVVSAAIKHGVLLFADGQVQVSVGAAARTDLGLAAHADLGTFAGTGRNVDAQSAARRNTTRAVALGAGTGDRRAETLTRRARCLRLHAAKQGVLDLRDEAGSLAHRAGLGRGTRLAHRAVAGVAQNVRLEGHFLCCTERGVLEGDVHTHLLVLASAHARGRAA